MKQAKRHKRTHLGPGPRTSRREPELPELKPITARPPRGRRFTAPVDHGGYTRLEEAPGCSRTYTPPDEE